MDFSTLYPSPGDKRRRRLVRQDVQLFQDQIDWLEAIRTKYNREAGEKNRGTRNRGRNRIPPISRAHIVRFALEQLAGRLRDAPDEHLLVRIAQQVRNRSARPGDQAKPVIRTKTVVKRTKTTFPPPTLRQSRH